MLGADVSPQLRCSLIAQFLSLHQPRKVGRFIVAQLIILGTHPHALQALAITCATGGHCVRAHFYGISCRPVPVCLCLSQVGVLPKWLNGSSWFFCDRGLLQRYNEIRVSPKQGYFRLQCPVNSVRRRYSM